MYVLYIFVCPFVFFLLAIVLSVSSLTSVIYTPQLKFFHNERVIIIHTFFYNTFLLLCFQCCGFFLSSFCVWFYMFTFSLRTVPLPFSIIIYYVFVFPLISVLFYILPCCVWYFTNIYHKISINNYLQVSQLLNHINLNIIRLRKKTIIINTPFKVHVVRVYCRRPF